MCGFIGSFSDREPIAREAVQRALAAMRHRGPDGTGTWFAPDGRAALGHARLAVIDLEGGAQPITNEDGSVVAVVNGELYGFEAIRDGLDAQGHRFRTRSDSEVLVHLYEEYGTACLSQLRGEFAFVLWDARNRLVFAARDRFGIKPISWTQAGGTLALASEAKALFAAGARAAWDEGAFFHAASHQYLPPDRTLFSGIRQLPPGHFLTAVDGVVRVQRYWDLDYPTPDRKRRGDDRELVEEFGRSLDEAVRLRLRADVPVACHLSGGLDSSAVLGLAARHARGPIDCFTVTFDEETYDELPLAHEMAAHAGARLHAVRVTQDAIVDALPEAVAHAEGLAINGHLPAKFLLAKAVRAAGHKVVLTGEGSDEIVAGYPHLRRDLFLAQAEESGAEPVAALARLDATNGATAGIQLPRGEGLPLGAVRRALGFVPSFLEAKATLGRRIHSVLSPSFVSTHSDRDAFAVLLAGFDVGGQLAGRHRVEQSMYLWTKLALANYILRTLGDGTETSHGIEGRLPFLDHHLFELARELPLDLKIRGTREKYVLREAVRPFVTEAIYRREKHPFMAPPITRFGSGRMRELVRDVFQSQSFASLPFFDRTRLLALVDALPGMDAADRTATEPVLMTALCAALLHEKLGLA